jgi:hypothetical protein
MFDSQAATTNMIPSDSASTFKEPTSFPYTDFIPTSRKKRKNKFRQERPPLSVLMQRVATELGHDRGWITQCQRLSFTSPFLIFRNRGTVVEILRDSLNSVSFTSPNVLCLGLGSPASSRDARVQLGFLLELCEHLDIVCASSRVYSNINLYILSFRIAQKYPYMILSSRRTTRPCS